MSLPEVEETEDFGEFVCRKTDSIFSAIEKCLDNGLGSVLVVDDGEVLVGRISLEDIRRAILSGGLLQSSSLERHLEVGQPLAGGQQTDFMADNEVLRATVNHSGQLTGVSVDRSKQAIQVSKPDLSHLEFRAVLDAFISSWISSKGPYIDKFEREFGDFVGTKYAVSVTNGTVALHLALVALGIGPGDEVIVPDLTFAATINAVLYCGATPVIVDVDRDTWCMTLQTMASACTSRTKAVIPVHLYGRPAEMMPIVSFARARGIAVVEDCAEAPGAYYRDKMVGQFGDVSCFSFYANKIVATGEGGMCLTNSTSLARSLRQLRDHGMASGGSYWHERVGYNYRLTNLQAAIGHSQLGRIDRTIRRNRQIEALYHQALRDIPGVRLPAAMAAEYRSVVWLACVQVPAEQRDQIIETARHARIEMRPFFHPLSVLPPYEKYRRFNPNSAALSATGINLPTSRDVDGQAIGRVAEVFRSVLA